jgi:hypothetical protein
MPDEDLHWACGADHHQKELKRNAAYADIKSAAGVP